MTNIPVLLDYLCDGKFHSGEDLATKMGVSRTAIWKQIKRINERFPIVIKSTPGKGYKISKPIIFVNRDEISQNLTSQCNSALKGIDVLLECPSTNQFLLERIENKKLENYLVLAESQTHGRGRRGREWVSPFASNIYMSLLWTLNISIAEMSGLSLVVAISVAKAIQSFGINNVMLKWPNDIYVDNKKLSGVLLELRGESNSPCNAVIGIGVNVNMPKLMGDRIDQQWSDMESILKKNINRNHVVSQILNELIPRLEKFNEYGFSEFIDEWNSFDLLAEQKVIIEGNMNISEGVALGVDKQGALLVEHNGLLQSLYSGEVSIRAV